MKQTAVEWLENEFKEICKDFGGLHTDFIERFDQAKEMEKEQIKEAYTEGAFEKMRHLDGKDFMMPTEYYNETFKTE